MSAREADAARRSEIAALLPQLRAFARFLTRNQTEADDLVQDGIVRALGALSQLQPDANLRAWLFAIVRNAFFEQARRRRTELRALEQVAHSEASREAIPLAPQEREAEVTDLERLLWTLSPLLREALVLVGAQGLTHDEAAEICGVPPGTIRARVSRARAQIAAALAPKADA